MYVQVSTSGEFHKIVQGHTAGHYDKCHNEVLRPGTAGKSLEIHANTK